MQLAHLSLQLLVLLLQLLDDLVGRLVVSRVVPGLAGEVPFGDGLVKGVIFLVGIEEGVDEVGLLACRACSGESAGPAVGILVA